MSKDGTHKLNYKINSTEATVLPWQTKRILVNGPDGSKLVGTPMDGCWAFLMGTGKIRTYSINAESDNFVIAYIQKSSEAPIVLLTKENLGSMVSDNEKALKLVEKGKLLKALEVYNKGGAQVE